MRSVYRQNESVNGDQKKMTYIKYYWIWNSEDKRWRIRDFIEIEKIKYEKRYPDDKIVGPIEPPKDPQLGMNLEVKTK